MVRQKQKKNELLIQRYVKNIMLYNGRKFDLRIYWAILSVDPLIVVYHDGTLRVSLGAYNTKILPICESI